MKYLMTKSFQADNLHLKFKFFLLFLRKNETGLYRKQTLIPARNELRIYFNLKP